LNSKQQPLPKILFTCKQITTFEPNKNTARLSIQNYDYPNSKFSKKETLFSCGHSIEHLAGRIPIFLKYASGQLAKPPLGWPLAPETLHHSQLPSPSLPRTSPHQNLAGKPRIWQPIPPRLPSELLSLALS
jgi:hypothetical protein